MLVVALMSPVLFLGIILALAYLEEEIVAPTDRAATIRRLIERSSPDEVERVVASLLAPVTHRTRASA